GAASKCSARHLPGLSPNKTNRGAAAQRGRHGVLCHAWMWWVTEDRRLSKKAAAPIQAAIAKGGVWLPAIAIWEIAKKAEKRKLVFDRPVRQWIEDATAVPGLWIADLKTSILIERCEVAQPFHGDPADQMIVAPVGQHEGGLI